MRFSDQAIRTEATEITFFDQEAEYDQPTLPLKLYTDQQEFEKKVQALLKEHELNKPIGMFF